MNFFNLFKKDVVLHCYTDKPDVYNFSSVKEAKNFIPEWWKRIPKHYRLPTMGLAGPDLNTMKSCSGFTDLYRQGFMLPMWSDCEVVVGETGSDAFRYEYSNGYSIAQSHPETQRGTQYPTRDYLHLKFESEWRLMCEEDVDFLLTAPVWNYDAPESLIVLPGVLNFKYQSSLNINVLFKRKATAEKYLVPFGMPIAHLVPLTERKLVIKTHLVSSETLKRINSITTYTTFAGKHSNNKRILKASGCPFHFKAEK